MVIKGSRKILMSSITYTQQIYIFTYEIILVLNFEVHAS